MKAPEEDKRRRKVMRTIKQTQLKAFIWIRLLYLVSGMSYVKFICFYRVKVTVNLAVCVGKWWGGGFQIDFMSREKRIELDCINWFSQWWDHNLKITSGTGTERFHWILLYLADDGQADKSYIQYLSLDKDPLKLFSNLWMDCKGLQILHMSIRLSLPTLCVCCLMLATDHTIGF